MFYVYILESESKTDEIYIGYTSNMKQRLKLHNQGAVKHTSKFKPWKIISCICFLEEPKAINFEKYLKSHSGRAFLRKRLI